MLRSEDGPAVERFLRLHPDTTLFLRVNLRDAGLVDGDEVSQGHWAGAWDGDRVVAVASHFWNGNLILQAPVALPELVRLALRPQGRVLAGIVGPWNQALAARQALGMAQAPMRLASRQLLYALALAELRAPDLLDDAEYEVRAPLPAEQELLLKWRLEYTRETKAMNEGPTLEATLRASIKRLGAAGHHWVLARRGEPVAYSAFNAVLPDVVQVGGVWTPPPLRGRGYGRAVVAGTLVIAQGWGASRSVLFTDEHNLPAQQAYEALGYTRVGEYGILGFA